MRIGYQFAKLVHWKLDEEQRDSKIELSQRGRRGYEYYESAWPSFHPGNKAQYTCAQL